MTDREIDVLVAEKVMGWRIEWWEHEGGRTNDFACFNGEEFICGHFAPSTDIAAAWEVMEHLQDHYHFDFRTEMLGYGIRITSKVNDLHFVQLHAETMPMAICLAALKAVSVEVPA